MLNALMTFGALSAATSVVLGAFGAHALKGKLSISSQATFETAVHYQMTHSLGLLLVGVLMLVLGVKTPWLTAAWSFTVGIFLFSGSLYGLALLGWRWLGPVTPVGGALFIVGWLALAYGLLTAVSRDAA
ncbi:MAG TPA: DUF423 domain-containing protein [Gammaproteobacteria bacterium]|nr:DUF423 domain-containing protein [Gammaproteobacteria bacterium]MDA8626979.1 DUF423 domain-containing protein [Pseudomonadales bacterium]MBT5463531.1 DUF423 domain-containing protein [Gammaproteobacteria bacterium]MBT6793798.1 DUF423 domain-containing protein [Gammaproteobacteria bacterium]MBT7387362.1 DUF423 domain-containing protein [Gammaproteobacteria bacterium]